MSFVTFTPEGLLQFTLPDRWKGTITTTFHGPHVKQVDIKREGVILQKLKSCPLSAPLSPGEVFIPDGGSQVFDDVKNTSGADVTFTVQPRFTPAMLCPGVAPPFPTDTFSLGNELSSSEKVKPVPANKSSTWLFIVPAPDGDTVGISIVIEDNSGGGQKHRLTTITEKLRKRMLAVTKALQSLHQAMEPRKKK